MRTINWKVNTTIRQLIWRKLDYKASRYALQTKQVWPRGSSPECPRCGKLGHTCQSPEHPQSTPYGHWFCCPNPACGFNADRDYVASLNVGRRALLEDYPSDEKTDVVCQPASYMGAGAALPFPSPDALATILVLEFRIKNGRIASCAKPPLGRKFGYEYTKIYPRAT